MVAHWKNADLFVRSLLLVHTIKSYNDLILQPNINLKRQSYTVLIVSSILDRKPGWYYGSIFFSCLFGLSLRLFITYSLDEEEFYSCVL